MTTTPNLGITHVADEQVNPEPTVNEAFDLLDQATQGEAAIDLDTAVADALTISAADFVRFVLTMTNATQVVDVAVTVPDGARYFMVDNRASIAATIDTTTGSTNTIVVPPGGRFLIHSTGTELKLAGSNLYDLAFFFGGLPADGALLVAFVATRQIVFRAGLPGFQSKAQVAATAAAIFTIKKNGAPVGTLQFSAASGVADTVTFATTTTFAIGDELTIVAPTPQDATLSDVTFTFAPYRTL